MAQTKVDKTTKKLFENAFLLSRRLNLETQGQYEELYNEYMKPIDDKSNLAEVVQKYNLYKAAIELGLHEEAGQYKAVVLEKGGTTCYRERLSQDV